MKVKRNDVMFIGAMVISVLLIGGMIVENYSLTTKAAATKRINVEEVKEKIAQAGLIPREARHWIEIQ